jgi:hypothetical protein
VVKLRLKSPDWTIDNASVSNSSLFVLTTVPTFVSSLSVGY